LPIEIEQVSFLSTHLGRLLLGLLPQTIYFHGQGFILGHDPFNLVEAPFPVLRRFHCDL
jgi:hypothetical protein